MYQISCPSSPFCINLYIFWEEDFEILEMQKTKMPTYLPDDVENKKDIAK
jgi:hypothetical protein